MEKKAKPRVPKARYPITDLELLDALEKSIKFPLPTGGIHKPELWKTKDSWGILYKVLCPMPPAKLKQKTNSYDVIILKWAGRKDVLIPQKGFDPFVKTIDIGETFLFRQWLANILNNN
jgi:hypothetical protein